MSRLALLAPGVALALTALLALAEAGCGSAPLSTGALRTRAARVCQLATARAESIPSPTLPVQALPFLKRGITVLVPELNALAQLRPGGRAAPAYATGLQALRRELVMVQDTAVSLRGGADPVIAVKTLERQLAPIEARGNVAWESLQIPACLAR